MPLALGTTDYEYFPADKCPVPRRRGAVAISRTRLAALGENRGPRSTWCGRAIRANTCSLRRRSVVGARCSTGPAGAVVRASPACSSSGCRRMAWRRPTHFQLTDFISEMADCRHRSAGREPRPDHLGCRCRCSSGVARQAGVVAELLRSVLALARRAAPPGLARFGRHPEAFSEVLPMPRTPTIFAEFADRWSIWSVLAVILTILPASLSRGGHSIRAWVAQLSRVDGRRRGGSGSDRGRAREFTGFA